MKKNVLLLCTGNSGRSIMAEALVNMNRGDKWNAFSAGTRPKGVNPKSKTVLEEIGAGVSDLRSKHVDEFKGRQFDLVVTLCGSAAESCPFFPGAKKQEHLGFDDPDAATGSEEDVLAEFRRIRDEISLKLIALLDEN